MSPVLKRQEWFSEDGFRGAAERAHGFTVETAEHADEFVATGGEDGHLEAAFDGFGAGVGEERKLEIARRDQRDEVCEVGAQRIDQFLRVDSLPVQLVENSFENLRVPVTGDVDAEATEHVDEFLAVDVLEACAFV